MSESPYEQEIIVRDIPTEFTVKFYQDDIDDFSHMGNYSDQWSPGAIDRELAEDVSYFRYTNSYRYWIPTPGCEDWESYQKSTRKWYQKHGYNKHQSSIAAHQHRAQDFNRMVAYGRGDWYYMLIVVESAWGQESLGGIESDSDDYSPDYIQSIIDGLIDSLIEQKEITVRIR